MRWYCIIVGFQEGRGCHDTTAGLGVLSFSECKFANYYYAEVGRQASQQKQGVVVGNVHCQQHYRQGTIIVGIVSNELVVQWKKTLMQVWLFQEGLFPAPPWKVKCQKCPNETMHQW